MTHTTSEFDGNLFAKLVLLLDSPQDAEAGNAMHHLRLMLRKHGLKLHEAVEMEAYKSALWEGHGQPECLRPYFESAAEVERECAMRMEAERIGAAIAEAAGAANARLQIEIEGLRAALVAEQQAHKVAAKGPRPLGGIVVGLAAAFLVLLIAAVIVDRKEPNDRNNETGHRAVSAQPDAGRKHGDQKAAKSGTRHASPARKGTRTGRVPARKGTGGKQRVERR